MVNIVYCGSEIDQPKLIELAISFAICRQSMMYIQLTDIVKYSKLVKFHCEDHLWHCLKGVLLVGWY